MQSHDDAGIRKNPAHQCDEFDADQQRMVDMHHVRPELLQETHEVRYDAIGVDLAHVEPVEMSAPYDHFIGSVARRIGSWCRDAAHDEVWFVAARNNVSTFGRERNSAKEIVREDFRPAGMEIRMVMRDDEDAQ